jgi:hypothetical protein
MNKPFTPSPAYEQDVYGWSQHQAESLRAGRLSEIDRPNIAEEIESVARAQYNKLKNAVRVALSQMLKWDQLPDHRSRVWSLTIREQRNRIRRTLRQNPTLKSAQDKALAESFRLAVIVAAREADVPLASFPGTNPYTWQDITDRPYRADDE